MNLEELINILQLGEDSKIQFKETFNSPDALAAEIGAFANSLGGRIIVGVSDSGDIKGLAKDEIKRLNQMISNVCSQKINPPISVTTENIKYENKIVIVINIPLGQHKFYTSNGSDIWVKVGADKRKAKREEIKRLLQESAFLFADEQIIEGTSVKDLDMDLVEEFLENKMGGKHDKIKMQPERILHNMKLMSGNFCTIAGLVLFGRKSYFRISQFYIAAVSWYGNDVAGVKYRESEDIRGNIVRLYEDGMAFIKRQLKKLQNGQNFNSLGILEIPEIAIQEALVNAIIHRNYFISSNIRIFVFDNRVEIISPGALPNTLDIESIKAGVRVARNPVILSHIKLMPEIPYRELGSGIPRIIDSCADAGIKVDFLNQKDGTGQFKVVFWRQSKPI
ncbi:MAG: putative DNA binding domain-containing protein [Syntrophomonadaceae bacterium]|nr:putative DNA binding domain-containing protein [Syntrophomonadaceae bacterium]